MHPAWRASFFLFTTFASFPALACSYPEPPTIRSVLSKASSVFIFRLDHATYKRTEFGGGAHTAWVEGSIKLIHNLYGDPTRYRSIKFSTGWCGGVNLVVGHHYLIATNELGSEIKLGLSDGTVLDIEGYYNASRKKESVRSIVVWPVFKAIYGVEPLPASFPPRFIAERTTVQPPPPPNVD